MDRERTMVRARANLVERMKKRGADENECYDACLALKYEEYVTEIHNAEYALEKYAPYYHARESECPNGFKFLMLMNGWRSPFVALNELLKVICTNEMLLKRKQKQTGVKVKYKSRYRELEGMLQEYVNRNGQTERV